MSDQTEWLTAYVEKCMTRAVQDSVEEMSFYVDAVGFRSGTAACHVRVEEGDPVMVRVVATAVTGVRDSVRLLRELNGMNARSRIANAWYSDGDVHVECSLFAESVSETSLLEACMAAAEMANRIGLMLAVMYDGQTPYPPHAQADDSEEAA